MSSRLRLLRYKILELQELSRSIGSASSDAERVQTSMNYDGFTGLSNEVLDRETEYKKELAYFLDKQDEAIELIMQLDDELHIDILRLRYLESYTWDDVSRSLHYSRRHILRQHGLALLALDDILQDVTKCH